MNWYRVNSPEWGLLEVQANDEKDALFQYRAQKDINYPTANELEQVTIEEFLPAIKPVFVRVHLGFITINLIPEIAEKLGYKEGDRFITEEDMFGAINVQNRHIVQMWYDDKGEEMPENFVEASKLMVERVLNMN